MEAEGFSATELGALFGDSRENVSRYASGKVTIPGLFTLMMAGVVSDPQDRVYWLNLHITPEQRKLIAAGLEAKAPRATVEDIAGGKELARAIELLTESWRANGQKWELVVETLGDKYKRGNDAKTYGKGRKNRPGESKAG